MGKTGKWLFLFWGLMGCAPAPESKLFEKNVVQFSTVELADKSNNQGVWTTLPSKNQKPKDFVAGGPDWSFKTIRVRLFPILSAPPGEPFPITKNRDQVGIQNFDGLEVWDLKTGKQISATERVWTIFSQKSIFAQTSDGNWKKFSLTSVWVKPSDPKSFSEVYWDISKKGISSQVKFRGGFVLTPTFFKEDPEAGDIWSVINFVNLEEYLWSVIPSEVFTSWEMEALKAQAVAARTYALYNMVEARLNEQVWDVDPTTLYQSYRGSRVENDATTQSVNATQDQLAVYKGSPIYAMFSANSGGLTCSHLEYFGDDVPYLQSVRDVEGSEQAPGGTWKASINFEDLGNKISEWFGLPGARVQDIWISELTGPSKRVKSLGVHLEGKESVYLDNSKQRAAIKGYKSRYYDLVPSPPRKGKTLPPSIIGHGYGHGIGMSQWGAQLMAQKGSTFDRILKYYYLNIELKKIDDVF